MYRNEKKALLEICDTMHEAHEGIVSASDLGERTEICESCQQAAISIGESLERENAERYEDTVHELEQYCDLVYGLAENGEIDGETVRHIEEIADDVHETLSSIKPRLKIVFFPYKAEMWDSLESFYLAAREDPDCDAYLVPIPYFDFDSETGTTTTRYDGDRFPADENPIPFNQFDHKNGSIDIAYVHYPYDDHNLVTTTHPEYYSSELKKYVSKLVYAPYFVTSGYVADEQKDLPVYRNADYVVLQSEYAKKECEGTYFYDNILPFGSSKFDMIIKRCNEGGNVPEEWRGIIEGKRTLMLNSSINDLLMSNAAALDKLEYFFELIRHDERIAVIWRPHPLYESTLRAMRPELVERYEGIKQSFLEDKIGVYDTSPEISNTVAIADGYIGSGASSVINLFGAAGKPIFLFNNMLREPVGEDDRRVLQLVGFECVRGRYYMRPVNINAIFSISASNLSSPLRYEGSIPGAVNWTNALNGLGRSGDKLYMSPLFAEDAVCYDPVMKSVETLGSVGRKYDVRFSGLGIPLPSRKSVFFIPDGNKYLIMEYVIAKKEWLYHQECLLKLRDGIVKPNYIGMVYGGATYDDRLYYSTGVCNRVLMLESGTGRYKILHLGIPELTYEIRITLRGASKEGLWIGKPGSTDLFLAAWEHLSDIEKWRTYRMPEGYEFTHDNFGDMAGAHGGLWEHGKYMIEIPYRSPHMIKLDKTTGEISYIAEGFFKDSEKKGLGYELKTSGICGAGCPIGKNKYAVQRMRDLRIAIINLDDGSYEEFLPEIPKDIFEKIVPKDGGFFKGDVYDYFNMNESRLFPLENFLSVFAEDGYKDVKKQQIKELETLAANLDGTCGIKTHEFLKRVIEEEDIDRHYQK